MLPSLTIDDSHYGLWSHGVFSRDLGKESVTPNWYWQGANVTHIIWRQFASWIVFAGTVIRTPATLCKTISQIILLCPNKKMPRIHTRRIVAMMADMQMFRQRTEMNAPRETMNQKGAAMRHTDSSVAIGVFIPRPQPASRRLFYLGPKTTDGRLEITASRNYSHAPILTQEEVV